MLYERGEQILPVAQTCKFAVQTRAQVVRVFWSEVGHPSVFCVAPDQFLGIQFGRVCRKFLSHNFRVQREVVAHFRAAVVNVAAVPNNGQRAGALNLQLFQEPNGVPAVRVFIVGQQCEAQIQLLVRREGNGADRRDSVVSIPTRLHRRLPAWRISTPDDRGQHVAGFIQQRDMSASGLCFFFLSGGSLPSPSVRSRLRCVRVLFVRVAGCSNPNGL